MRLSLRKLRLYGRVEVSLLREGPPGSKDLLAVWKRKRENASAHHHHHVRTGISISGNSSFVPLTSVGAAGPSSQASGSFPHAAVAGLLGGERGAGSSTGVAAGAGGQYVGGQGDPLPRRSASGISTFLS